MSTKGLKELSINTELGLGATLFEYMERYRNLILQYLADSDETDTYGQVLERCIRTALTLKAMGISKNDVVSTCTHSHKNSCVPILASFFLGAIPANFDPNLSPLDTIHLLKLVQPKVIFVSSDSVPLMETCLTESKVECELVVFGESTKYPQFSEYLKAHPGEENFRPIKIEDNKETAIIMFSSGTTGLPKGICLSHYSILKSAQSYSLFVVKLDDKRSVNLLFTTFYWISALGCFIETVVHGDATVVCSKFDGQRTWELIEKYKVTFTCLTPYFSNELFHSRPARVDETTVRVFLIGGTPVRKSLLERFREILPKATVLNIYGLTEALGCVSRFDPEERELMVRKLSSCGKIRPIFQWKVVDPETDKILGPYKRGELRIQSDLLLNEYYKMDTTAAFDSEGYLKTGDIFYYDEDECLYAVDRIKEAFKYKGWHILPAVVEEVLMSLPVVKEAVVVGIPHKTDGEHPMGIVVLRDKSKGVTAKEIEEYAGQRVSEVQKLRAGVKIVDEILKTATGKVRRRDMKKLVIEGRI